MYSIQRTATARVLRVLSEEGPRNISEVARKSELAFSYMFRLLPEMERDGLVVSEKKGREKIYQLTDYGRDLYVVLYRRRQEEIRVLASKLDPTEIQVVRNLSLAETGLTPYELERRGIASERVMPTIKKLSEIGIVRVKSRSKTPSGRTILRYTTNRLGAELALEYLRKTSEGELGEERLRQICEGDFAATPVGSLYKQMHAVRVRSGLRR